MFKNIIKESIKEMYDDVKIIRLTFFTTFFHSLIMIFLIILHLNELLARNYEDGLYIGKVAEFFVEAINKNHVVAIVITITIALFLMYSIIYPIGQSAIIHYLKNKTTIRDSLKKGLNDFYPMFEFSIISVITSPILLFIVTFRIFVLGQNYSTFIIFLMGLWFVVMCVVNVLKAYTRYCITLEGLPLYESLKRSTYLARSTFFSSMKYVRIQTVLIINFSINLLVIAGIPILLIYLAISYNLIEYTLVKIFIYLVLSFLVLLSSYMSSFIRAFFAYYRYKLYEHVKEK